MKRNQQKNFILNEKFFRLQDRFPSNKVAADQLKNHLDAKYPWLEWIVIAYNTKYENEADTNAAYYNLSISYSLGSGSTGKQFNQFHFTLANYHCILQRSFS